MLAQLVVPLVPPGASGVEEHLPAADRREGPLLPDRSDPTLTWYVPSAALVVPDPSFSFAARRVGADRDGDPFHAARLELGVRLDEPPEVARARAERPGTTYRAVPLLDLDAELHLPWTDAAGQPQAVRVPAAVDPAPDGTHRIVVDGLLGPDVVLCYTQLRLLHAAELHLALRYRAVRTRSRRPWWPRRLPVLDELRPPRPLRPVRAVPPGRPVREPLVAGALRRPLEDVLDRRPRREPLEPPEPVEPVEPPEPVERAVVVEEHEQQVVRLADALARGDHPQRYTLQVGGTTRTIVDEADLAEFRTARSEYVELASLGDVSARFPSVRRVYAGRVTGTVVVVPAEYALVRSAAGCAALCQALVDPQAGGGQGSRFALVLGLAPRVDPVDLAGLAREVATAPELAGLVPRLTLPRGLDPRHPATLATPFASGATFTEGADPGTVVLTLDVRDDATPAVNKVNLLLGALAGSVRNALTGELAVRVDDVLEVPVRTAVTLDLHATSGSDDVTVQPADGAGTGVVLVNRTPYDLDVVRSAAVTDAGLDVAPVGQRLAPGASLALAAPPGAPVLVSRELALPPVVPKTELGRYVSFQVETVQQVRYVLGVNATGLDLAALGVEELRVEVTLADHPRLAVPPLVLTPARRADSVQVLVPVGSVVQGLGAHLVLRVRTAAGTRDVPHEHDFWQDPVLVLEAGALG
ncbi:hypothetical protein D5H78_09085 [Vallicoccus soli]|uniref:Uncharacterized protein n=1 Tax=Vallicoccus soli TaxID=2339232 RepID=A0A3A3YXK0_9ACTN|nr:hypothetical protein D5H78_09085 [Vallicoccus soli]